MNEQKTISESINELSFTLISIAVVAILGGFVFSKLYGWFILTQFNAPALRLPEFIGLIVIVRALVPAAKGSSKEPFWKQVLKTVGYWLIVLGFGYVVSLFI